MDELRKKGDWGMGDFKSDRTGLSKFQDGRMDGQTAGRMVVSRARQAGLVVMNQQEDK